MANNIKHLDRVVKSSEGFRLKLKTIKTKIMMSANNRETLMCGWKNRRKNTESKISLTTV